MNHHVPRVAHIFRRLTGVTRTAQLLHHILAVPAGEQVSSHSGHETSMTGAPTRALPASVADSTSQYASHTFCQWKRFLSSIGNPDAGRASL